LPYCGARCRQSGGAPSLPAALTAPALDLSARRMAQARRRVGGEEQAERPPAVAAGGRCRPLPPHGTPRRGGGVGGAAAPGILAYLCLARFAAQPAWGFYLPGVAPREYPQESEIEIKVNTLTSVKTQLPYSYYALPYCRPKEVRKRIENLGEILAGDDIQNSPYQLRMLKNETCKVLCNNKLTEEHKEQFRNMIDNDYHVNWIVDNLPGATKYIKEGGPPGEFTYLNGFPVGVTRAGHYYVHNHVSLKLAYHRQPNEYEGFRIVNFEVEPRSITQQVSPMSDAQLTGLCMFDKTFDLEMHNDISYTYDVQWEESPVRWASRWDSYLKMPTPGEVHWFSILNSLLIVIFLSALIATIMLRTLHREIVKYNELETPEEMAEETGWKLVHGDVFRSPSFSKLLVASVGSGCQILGMSVVTLFFATLGFLSPAQRGGLLQSTLLLFTFMGYAAGYSSARLYKTLEGESWKQATICTAFFYPGIIFTIFFLLNLLIWGEHSAGAVPFGTLFALLVLWFGISVPLVFLGAYHGFRKPGIELPVRTNAIPREIPLQQWYARPLFTSMLGGILPFGAVFTELFFIMTSIWQHQIYYLFGFLMLVFIILLITCAEISVTITYFTLTSEDYHWWWRSFSASAATGVYVFLYSVLYFNTRLNIEKTVSTMLYFGYMFIVSVVLALMTGAVGLISSFVFVRGIYGSIKVD